MKKINYALYTRESKGVVWQVEGKCTPDQQDMVNKEAEKIIAVIKLIERKLNKE